MKRPIKLVSLCALPLLGISLSPAQAACVTGPDSGGNDNYVCDSGTAASLTDLTGNNSLSMPAGGSGAITGNVTFGAGDDSASIDAGSIGGQLDMGDGANRLSITGGSITGAVIQGSGIDNFSMTGGTIGSLAQGNGRDIFFMSGGTIIGAFEDGDVGRMTGGTIGRVDMKLDNNIWDMSGGRIIGNLVTGLGQDTITISGTAFIGGNISTSAGVDIVTILGGEVGGNILLSTGNDQFTWRDGGLVHGQVQMGIGDDTATLANLTEAQLGSTALINGDTGNDSLLFDHTTTSVASRYTGWESIALNNGSSFALNDPLVLGDADSGTGSLSVDASSQIVSRSGSISAATAGQNVSVTNAGLIDLSSGGDALGRLTINGNYAGSGGRLKVNSVLNGEGAASDRLVVNQGTISGTTNLLVNNLGGIGGLTTANGIQVVEAANGATSSASAFSLGQPISVGAYQYYLFKGGVTADSANSWYLRSSVVAPPAPVPTPTDPTPEPLPTPVAAPETPPLPVPVAGESIALYRQEVPVYAVANRAAAFISYSTLSTFHERQGDQSLLGETGAVPAGWARVLGDKFRQQWSGTVSPSLDGSLRGFQVGHDLFANVSESGYRQHAGVYVSHTRLTGDVKGFALGWEDAKAGDIRLDGDSVGAYWTLIGPQQWYLDTTVQYTDLDGRARSERGVKLDLNGHAWAASVETGYPLPLSSQWVLEPQAQVIAQKVSLDSKNDGISNVEQDSQTNWTGRLGARLKGNYVAGDVPLEPYLRTNVWRSFGGRDTLTFDGSDPIKTDQAATWMDVGVGLSARLNATVSVYGGVNYSANLDSRQQEQIASTVGLRMSW